MPVSEIMKRPKSLIGWLQLMRPPNLPTVPGDPLAGLFLAHGIAGWNLVPLALASLGLYLSGLILNDVADLAIDRVERPERPLPSGRVDRSDALRVGLLFALAGLAAAALLGPRVLAVGVVLLGLILLYTFVTPRGSLAGILTMGLCRAFSVGLGIAAVNPAACPSAALAGAAGIGGTIVAISWIAADETRVQPLTVRRWLPLLPAALSLAYVLLNLDNPRRLPIAALLAAAALVRLALPAVRLGGHPAPADVPPAIGAWIRSLLLVQAACCATRLQGLPVAALLILLMPVSARLGRRYHAS